MRKTRSMRSLSCLKTGLRKNRSSFLFSLVLFYVVLIGSAAFSSEISDRSGYSFNHENQLFVSIIPGALDETRLKGTIGNGGKSEVSLKFRIRIFQDEDDMSLPQVNEVYITKTGFQDIITGDYILLINGREAGTYGEWEAFFRNFSQMNDFPLGVSVSPGDSTEVRCRMEVVYKKFVTPLNLLYLIPRRYITRGKWQRLSAIPYRGGTL